MLTNNGRDPKERDTFRNQLDRKIPVVCQPRDFHYSGTRQAYGYLMRHHVLLREPVCNIFKMILYKAIMADASRVLWDLQTDTWQLSTFRPWWEDISGKQKSIDYPRLR